MKTPFFVLIFLFLSFFLRFSVCSAKTESLNEALKLEWAFESHKPIDAGHYQVSQQELSQLSIEASILNAGQLAHPIVLPGDGSEVGWREPTVFWTIQKKGSLQKVAEKEYNRCGLFSFDWWSDIVLLKPGERRKIEWIDPPSVFFDLKPGTFVLQLHYRYNAGKQPGKGSQKVAIPPVTEEKMKLLEGVEPFELVSQPIELLVLEDEPASPNGSLRSSP